MVRIIVKPRSGNMNRLNRGRRAGCARNQAGSGIVEGVLGLVLIMLVTVGGGLLMVNLSMTAYYKQKLGVVSSSAAALASSLRSWEYNNNGNMSDGLLAYLIKPPVNRALQSMGLPNAKSVEVVVGDSHSSPGGSIMVRIVVDKLPLFGTGHFVPNTISVSESCTAPLTNSEPPGLATFVTGNGVDLSVPCYTSSPKFPKPYGYYQMSFAGTTCVTPVTVQYPKDYIPPMWR